jgi:hypothetical protein
LSGIDMLAPVPSWARLRAQRYTITHWGANSDLDKIEDRPIQTS